MPTKKRKRLSTAKKHARVFIKERITFYSNSFRDSKKQMFNALEERREIKAKLGSREPSKVEAERLDFLGYVAEHERKLANQYHNRLVKLKKKKERLFPEKKK